MDALESVFSYEVSSVCCDLFTSVYEAEPDLTPSVTPVGSELNETHQSEVILDQIEDGGDEIESAADEDEPVRDQSRQDIVDEKPMSPSGDPSEPEVRQISAFRKHLFSI